jgi:hypothetical protein
VSVGQLTFDPRVISDSSIERAIRRLHALTLETPKRLRAFRAPLAVTHHRSLVRRTPDECAVAEESMIASWVTAGKSGDASAMESLIQRYQPASRALYLRV